MTSSAIKNSKGFTLVEILVYAAGMVLIIGVIAAMIYYTYQWYSTSTISSRVNQIGLTLSDRIIKDIRDGASINVAQSTFGSDTGALSIHVALSDTQFVDRRYSLSSERMFLENGASSDFLSPADIDVSQFRVTQLPAVESQAVRFQIGITYTPRHGTATTTYFSGMATLRNSYE